MVNPKFLEKIKEAAQKKSSSYALGLIKSLKKQDKSEPLNIVLDVIFNQQTNSINWFQKALLEALAVPKVSQRDRILQRLTYAAAKKGNMQSILKASSKIADPEVKSYALSNSIHALIDQQKFVESLQILPSIVDEGAREDAIVAIMRYFANSENNSGAQDFIDQLSSNWEKRFAEQTFHSIYVANHLPIQGTSQFIQDQR